MKRAKTDALYWSRFAGAPAGEIHLAVTEAIRCDKRIPQEAWNAVKAKHDIIGGKATPEEFVEALDSIRRDRHRVDL